MSKEQGKKTQLDYFLSLPVLLTTALFTQSKENFDFASKWRINTDRKETNHDKNTAAMNVKVNLSVKLSV